MLFNIPFKRVKRECKHIEALLWNYAGGRLTDSERVQVATHLDHCPACRTQLQAYARTQRGMDTLRAQSVPTSAANWQDVRARLMAAQTAANVVPRPLMAWRKGIGWGAAATAAMGMLLWLKLAGHVTEPKPLFAEVNATKPPKVTLALPPENSETVAGVPPFAKVASLPRTAETEALRPDSLMPSPLLSAFGVRSGWPRNSPTVTLAADRAGNGKAGATPRSHHNHPIHWRRSPGVWRVHRSRNPQETMLASALPREILVPVGFGNPLPEYVMTAVQTDDAHRRDFVMDSVDADAANGESEYAGEAGEEIRAW